MGTLTQRRKTKIMPKTPLLDPNTPKTPDWNEWFLQQVYLVAKKSKDPDTRIGAIIVRGKQIISSGYNGIPAGVQDPLENDSPKLRKRLFTSYWKRFFCEHAERNAIYQAAKFGISTQNATLITPGIPCADCTRGAIQAGISKLIIHKEWPNLRHRKFWIDTVRASTEMLEEAQIPIEVISIKNLGTTAWINRKNVRF